MSVAIFFSKREVDLLLDALEKSQVGMTFSNAMLEQSAGDSPEAASFLEEMITQADDLALLRARLITYKRELDGADQQNPFVDEEAGDGG